MVCILGQHDHQVANILIWYWDEWWEVFHRTIIYRVGRKLDCL